MIMLVVIVLVLLLIGGGVWGWPLVAAALGISSVTDKPGALKNIAQLMNTYDITLDEVDTALQNAISLSSQSEKRDKGDIAKTLFVYLGAIFIFAGISTYIGMFWESMSSAMRVFVTLGVSYVLLVVLVSALHEKKFPKLILPLALISAFTMTGGWFVFIHEVFPDGDNWRAAVLFVFGMMALHQGVLLGKYQRTVMAFTAMFFVYGFMQVGLDLLGVPIEYIAIFLGTSLFLMDTALEKTSHRILVEPILLIAICWLNSGLFDVIAVRTSPNWACLLIGACLVSAAFGLQKEGRYSRLIGLGYFFGSAMIYSGLFDLLEHTPFELLYIVVTASTLYTCLLLQSRALLLTTILAMLSFIGYYSTEHFANSLGWPITLMLMGVAFLGVGAVAIKVKKRMG